MKALEKEDVLVVLRLLASTGDGARTLGRILGRCLAEGSRPASLADLSCQELQATLSLSEASARAFASDQDAAGQLWEELVERSIRMLLRGWPGYPKQIAAARGDDAPPVVFVIGNVDLLARPAVGFCGSRKASERGLAITEECARSVASDGLNVLSGYAQGVDLAAIAGHSRRAEPRASCWPKESCTSASSETSKTSQMTQT